jgi:hypothetical protein
MKKKCLLLVLMLAPILPWVGCRKSEKSAKPVVLPSGPVELTLQWPVDRRMVERMDIRQTSEITLPGMPNPMKQNMNLGQTYSLSVLRQTPEGGREVEMQFLTESMLMTMGDQTLADVDTGRKGAADTNNPVAALLQQLVGARLQFILNASNRVEAVRGVDGLRQRLAPYLAGGGPGMAESIGSIYQEDYFRQMLDRGRNLPEHPVAPGDTWPVKLEVSMGQLGTMVLNYTFTLAGWEVRDHHACAMVTFEGTITSKSGPNPGPSGMSINVQQGKSSGETWFDIDRGVLTQSDAHQVMKLQMSLPQAKGATDTAGARARPQTLAVDLDQIVTTRLESVN